MLVNNRKFLCVSYNLYIYLQGLTEESSRLNDTFFSRIRNIESKNVVRCSVLILLVILLANHF